MGCKGCCKSKPRRFREAAPDLLAVGELGRELDCCFAPATTCGKDALRRSVLPSALDPLAPPGFAKAAADATAVGSNVVLLFRAAAPACDPAALGEEGNEEPDEAGDEGFGRAAAPRATGRMEPKDGGPRPGAWAHMDGQKLPSTEASSVLR
mmetsp:Transcript_5630/g.11188  ORF Transcript_5630/g.11188 Transcript_5630/m.11188 type:complete len:152 (-) Transcript_5630:1063-1518(-)